jgi:hypothetical protein
MRITTRRIVGLLARDRGMGDLPVDAEGLSAPLFEPAGG